MNSSKRIRVDKNPFSKTFMVQILHYDVILAVINLRHMLDTAEGGNPKYLDKGPHFGSKHPEELSDNEKWIIETLWDWWSDGMPDGIDGLRDKFLKEGQIDKFNKVSKV